jgi:hypothetical protein
MKTDGIRTSIGLASGYLGQLETRFKTLDSSDTQKIFLEASRALQNALLELTNEVEGLDKTLHHPQ